MSTLLRATVHRTFAAGLLAALLAVGGIPARAASAEDELAVWMATAAPRRLALRVLEPTREPTLIVRDHKPAERVGRTAAGAAVGAAAPLSLCMGGPIGCLMGALLVPAGLVVGTVAGAVSAASVQSVERTHPIRDAAGLPELHAREIGSGGLSGRMAQALLLASSNRPFSLGPAPEGAGHDGELVVRLEVDFAGHTGENPVVALLVRATPSLRTTDGDLGAWEELSFQGSGRTLEHWNSDGGSFFRKELDEAVRTISARLVERLGTPPVPEQARRPGTVWTYAYHDQIYGRVSRSFSIRSATADAGMVTDHLSAPQVPPSPATFDAKAMDFATRAIAPGRTIVEFAPYADLRAMQREPRDLAARTIAGGEWKIRVLGIRQDTAQVPAGTFPVLCIDVEGSAGGGAHALQNSLPSNIHALSRFRHTGCYAHAVGRYVTARHSQWDVHGRKVTDDLVSHERFEAAN